MTNRFHLIDPKQWQGNPFTMIGDQWFLLCTEAKGKANAMTASWGGVGVLWRKNVATAYVRKSRFSKGLMDEGEYFSLCFFEHEPNVKMLGYMGTASGKNENKIEKAQLTLEHHDEVPYLAEASTVLLCKKLCCQPIEPANILQADILDSCYGDKDYHDMYIGEILGVLTRE